MDHPFKLNDIPIPSPSPPPIDDSPPALTVSETIEAARSDQLLRDLKAITAHLEANPDAAASQTLQQQIAGIRSALPDSTPRILPPTKEKIAPNQSNAWRATAASMGSAPAPKKRVIGMQVKTGVKRKHLDAYAGGEQSGKKARPDALSVEASIKASQLPPSQPSQPGRRPDHFDVNTFDISDASALGNLRRDELIELCVHYRLRKSGSKPILINALVSASQPRNGVPICPSATGSSADPTGPSTSSNTTQAEAAVSLHPHALRAVPPPHHIHPNPYLYTTMQFYYPGPRQSQ